MPHDNKLEVIWTAVPAVVMCFLVIRGLVAWNEVMADVSEGEEHIEIEATGQQYLWHLRYPGADGKLGTRNFRLIKSGENPLGQDWMDDKNLDDIMPSEIVLPVGKKVRVRITAMDVLHSFDLPHFRVKMDAVPGMPTYFVFTPTKVGLLTIRDEIRGVEITIQTLPTAIASKFDTNGMWFDAATNGSGIALHHRRGTTDAAFGTWFLYSNDGTSRWYTLQSTNWQQDGSVLEGLLIQTRGGCAFANLAGCPALGSFRGDPPQDLFWVTPPLARITFQSPTRARAEVLTLGGAVLFTSELTKLQF